MSSVEQEWARIEAWMRANASTHFRCGPPAAAKALASLEAQLGRPLPPELSALLSRCNGASLLVRTQEPKFSWQLLNTGRILDDWNILEGIFQELVAGSGPEFLAARVTGPMRPLQWSAAWIPFATNRGGDLLCVDTEPAAGGALGQIILYLGDDDRREVLFPAISAMLKEFADGLERGDYVVHPYSGVEERSDDD